MLNCVRISSSCSRVALTVSLLYMQMKIVAITYTKVIITINHSGVIKIPPLLHVPSF